MACRTGVDHAVGQVVPLQRPTLEVSHPTGSRDQRTRCDVVDGVAGEDREGASPSRHLAGLVDGRVDAPRLAEHPFQAAHIEPRVIQWQ